MAELFSDEGITVALTGDTHINMAKSWRKFTPKPTRRVFDEVIRE